MWSEEIDWLVEFIALILDCEGWGTDGPIVG